MSGPQDDSAGGPFASPALKLGKHDKLELLDGKRVYHAGSPYPDWQVRDSEADDWAKAEPFFNIDTYLLRHQKFDGSISEPMVREVFERGNSVGVLLYNRDTDRVICVEQLRIATLDRDPGQGWIVETVAGVIREGEKPEETAIREVEEETGYRITNPEPVSTFFSSPGGTSEKIYLFFAEVTNREHTGNARRDPSEDIRIVEYNLDAFRQMVANRQFVDPKLVIAAYYLQARLRLSIAFAKPLASSDGPIYALDSAPDFKIGIRTGDILDVTGIDVWLNPENRYMMMSRVIDEGVSASVRWGGAKKYSDGSVEEDLIGRDMQVQMAGRSEARATEIIETTPGELYRLGVRRLLHLPVAEANAGHSDGNVVRARKGLRARPQDIRPMVFSALRTIHEGNVTPARALVRMREWLQGRGWYCESVLVPLLGTGEGRLSPREAVPQIVAGILDFANSYRGTSVRRIHLLAYYPSDLADCQMAIEETGQFNSVAHW